MVPDADAGCGAAIASSGESAASPESGEAPLAGADTRCTTYGPKSLYSEGLGGPRGAEQSPLCTGGGRGGGGGKPQPNDENDGSEKSCRRKRYVKYVLIEVSC